MSEVASSDNSNSKKIWRKGCFSLIKVRPQFAMVTLGFTGTIRARGLKKLEKCDICDLNKITYELIKLSDEDLDNLYIKYNNSSINSREKRIIENEKEYRTFLKNKFLPFINDFNNLYSSAVNKRKYLDEFSAMKNDSTIKILLASNQKIVVEYITKRNVKYQCYGSKKGLRINFPWNKYILISTEERHLDTQNVVLKERRTLEFDVDPWFKVVDPRQYVIQLQSDVHCLDETKLLATIGSRINDVFREYISSHGEEMFLNTSSSDIMNDEVLSYKMDEIGRDFGIKFIRTTLERKNTDVVNKQNDEAAAVDKYIETYNKYVSGGVNELMASYLASGDKFSGSGNDMNSMLMASLLLNNNNNNNNFNNNSSNSTIQFLESKGVCNSYGVFVNEYIGKYHGCYNFNDLNDSQKKSLIISISSRVR